MGDVTLPAVILLYITGATYVVGILVNGIRTAVVLPPIVSFLLAVLLGFVFVVLFAVANGVTMTVPLWAGSVIAGVMVGGASAGANAVHARSLPTTAPPTPDADPPAVTVERVADELERRRDERVQARLHSAATDPRVLGVAQHAARQGDVVQVENVGDVMVKAAPSPPSGQYLVTRAPSWLPPAPSTSSTAAPPPYDPLDGV